jgi:hypothetical protein
MTRSGLADFHIKMHSKEVSKEWTKLDFVMGNNHKHKMYAKAKYMCICVWVIRGRTSYELCGTEIEDV